MVILYVLVLFIIVHLYINSDVMTVGWDINNSMKCSVTNTSTYIIQTKGTKIKKIKNPTISKKNRYVQHEIYKPYI